MRSNPKTTLYRLLFDDCSLRFSLRLKSGRGILFDVDHRHPGKHVDRGYEERRGKEDAKCCLNLCVAVFLRSVWVEESAIDGRDSTDSKGKRTEEDALRVAPRQLVTLDTENHEHRQTDKGEPKGPPFARRAVFQTGTVDGQSSKEH